MNWAEWFYCVTGIVVWLLFAALCCVLFYFWLRDKLGATHVRSYEAGVEYVRRDLSQASHWFSEDAATSQLLTDLSQNKAFTAARERWREARTIAPDPCSEPQTPPREPICKNCGKIPGNHWDLACFNVPNSPRYEAQSPAEMAGPQSIQESNPRIGKLNPGLDCRVANAGVK